MLWCIYNRLDIKCICESGQWGDNSLMACSGCVVVTYLHPYMLEGITLHYIYVATPTIIV